MRCNVNIIKAYADRSPCYKTGRKIVVKGLMLHSVGCSQPRASAFATNWNSEKQAGAMVHAFIDAINGDIYQLLPWNHRAWHAASGDNGSANNTHIGVEMCEPSAIKYVYGAGATFTVTDWAQATAQATTAYAAAVELFAYLCHEFNLDPLKDGVIISHAEGYKRGIASNHGDPQHLWSQLHMTNKFGKQLTMDDFRADVAERLEDENMTQEKFNEMMEAYLAERGNKKVASGMKEAWNEAKDEGYMDGKRPASYITRQEVAQVIHNIRNAKGDDNK